MRRIWYKILNELFVFNPKFYCPKVRPIVGLYGTVNLNCLEPKFHKGDCKFLPIEADEFGFKLASTKTTKG